jgi:hypothetical protein
MGLVLDREDDTIPAPPAAPAGAHPVPHAPYDVYVVFRGSRSGAPRALRALGTETGNPDWVTDMDFGLGAGAVQPTPEISVTGNVSPGFAASMSTMLPTIMRCLEDIQNRRIHAPRAIYVTGHSLAAAFAVHFTSAVLLGARYGHTVDTTTFPPSTPRMPQSMRSWPWRSTQLVPFALPIVGGESFHHAFNIALASRQIYLRGDPVAQRVRRYAVGRPYELVPEHEMNPTKFKKRGVLLAPSRHEPFHIRKYLIKDLQAKEILPRDLPQDFPIAEPWKVFKNFKALLAELSNRDHTGQVSEILGADFNIQLRNYLLVLMRYKNSDPRVGQLIAVVDHINSPAGAINWWGAIPASNAPLTFPGGTFYEIYRASQGIFQSDSDFDHFIGLCLFLTAASKTTYHDANTRTAAAPFMTLKFK